TTLRTLKQSMTIQTLRRPLPFAYGSASARGFLIQDAVGAPRYLCVCVPGGCRRSIQQSCRKVDYELSPNSPDAENNLGNMLLSRGRDDEAIAPLNRALESNPSLPEAHFQHGAARSSTRKRSSRSRPLPASAGLRQEFPSCFAALAWILGTHAGHTPDDRRE